jgi:hypothetical protein
MQEPTKTQQEHDMARQFYEDTTTQEYAEQQDQAWLREDQQQWFEMFRTEAELCAVIPAAEEHFRALHMTDIPF